MIKAASSDKLRAGFQEHLKQTEEHAKRLEKILSNHGQITRGKKCKGIEGVITEGAEMIEEEADSEVRDAGLISAAQRVEHYETVDGRYRRQNLGDEYGRRRNYSSASEA
jgi:ferritin-like metal-binding protein YciE